MTEFKLVPFHGDTIFTAQQPDGIYVAIKPVSDRLGLGWNGQLKRIKDDPVLSKGMQTVCIPSTGGMQETMCLQRKYFGLWLAKIDSRRVSEPEVAARIVDYQEHCCEAIDRYFVGGDSEAAYTVHGPVEDTAEFDSRRLSVALYRSLLQHVSLALRINGVKAAQQVADTLRVPVGNQFSELSRQGDLFEGKMIPFMGHEFEE